jgi:hypothetical protein
VLRYFPLTDDTVFAYETTNDAGARGIYVMLINRPRDNLAELIVAGRITRRYILPDGIQAAGGGYTLRAPLREGAEWQGEFGKVVVKTLRREIRVPAGHFTDCLETFEHDPTSTELKQATAVFCPGVGLVYYLLEGEHNAGLLSEKLELKSHGPVFDGLQEP